MNYCNLATAIRTWAVLLVRYGAAVIDWTQQEPGYKDRRARKVIHIYGTIYPRADVDRLYVQRDDSGRGLMSTLDTGRYEEQGMIEYI